MRSIVTPDTPRMREDLVQRLMESELEVVALIRIGDQPTDRPQRLELAVYQPGMLGPAELRRRMEGCDVVFQDVYSFAHLRRRPDEDDVFREAWSGTGLASPGGRRGRAVREDVYVAPDAVVRLHLWSDALAGPVRELPRPLFGGPSVLGQLGRQALEVTLILPPRLGQMQDGTTIESGRHLRDVLAELLNYWASLKLR